MDRSRAGHWTFLVVAIVLAAVFARLGMWQLDRLGERRDANRFIEARMALPPADLATLTSSVGASADSLAWRSVLVRGKWDIDREIVIRGRARHGTPGIHVVTPLVFNADRGVLVLRGWLPAADGLSADLAGARPGHPDSEVELEGLALESEAPSRIPPRTSRFEGSEHLVLGSIAIRQASKSTPYDLLPVFVLAAPEGETPDSPAAVTEPRPSDGPHLWYAFQWFGFSLISLAGATVYVRANRRSASSEGGGP